MDSQLKENKIAYMFKTSVTNHLGALSSLLVSLLKMTEALDELRGLENSKGTFERDMKASGDSIP